MDDIACEQEVDNVKVACLVITELDKTVEYQQNVTLFKHEVVMPTALNLVLWKRIKIKVPQ